MKTILVAGGAGFIGSHMTQMLSEAGHRVIVLDNLSTGHFHAVRNADLVVGDLRDVDTVDSVFAAHRIDAVMHFAARSQVGESMQHPQLYYDNNVGGSVVLLDAMQRHGVRDFIFSSTAAVYGHPGVTRIVERTPTAPINPYGRSKLMVENILADLHAAGRIRYTALRYFNAAGADPRGRLGECHEPETHLIPLVLQVAIGRRPSIGIFGTDYDTEDGSCVRDYVHVQDLCSAHALALQHLWSGGESGVFNLGNGSGYSVRQVIDAARDVTGHGIPALARDRRAGDPACLVADSSRARRVLGWQPRYPGLPTMIRHAWRWELGGAEQLRSSPRLQPHPLLRQRAA